MLTSEDEVPYRQIQDPGIKVEHNGVSLQRSVKVLDGSSTTSGIQVQGWKVVHRQKVADSGMPIFLSHAFSSEEPY